MCTLTHSRDSTVTEPYGDVSTLLPLQVTKVSNIISHKKYTTRTKEHDIALVKVKTQFSWTGCVRPIAILTGIMKPLKKCTVTGWGSTMESNWPFTISFKVQPLFREHLKTLLDLLDQGCPTCRNYSTQTAVQSFSLHPSPTPPPVSPLRRQRGF